MLATGFLGVDMLATGFLGVYLLATGFLGVDMLATGFLGVYMPARGSLGVQINRSLLTISCKRYIRKVLKSTICVSVRFLASTRALLWTYIEEHIAYFWESPFSEGS